MTHDSPAPNQRPSPSRDDEARKNDKEARRLKHAQDTKPRKEHDPTNDEVTGSSATRRSLHPEEPQSLAERGLSQEPEGMAIHYLADATQQSNFESREEPRFVVDADSEQEVVTKQARLTVSPEEIRNGKLCSCVACVRDGQHEPDCGVHDEPQTACSCGVREQRESAG